MQKEYWQKTCSKRYSLQKTAYGETLVGKIGKQKRGKLFQENTFSWKKTREMIFELSQQGRRSKSQPSFQLPLKHLSHEDR